MNDYLILKDSSVTSTLKRLGELRAEGMPFFNSPAEFYIWEYYFWESYQMHGNGD